ncbi:putative hypoxanthine-guanine phosphoribosyltransferase [Gregarina niphandrodes]|uniref:Hypoxanthine-guanine phosphoribosyltransferase n=1 Tax=Gregarina niphandrodes TaxID=110365 RepID=A0A023B8U6_GRENI|nr:putative hypoxanthine-guanine phosphoribosyltransferase [Gregarina niphandrodes]EZG70503.1 putative hypoxanthine-guanine phosphoribosyltransferase [Gregarina niphandrodes]|eukprot:XP_011129923.1 putative hypoxanthine-guanine phosphoribosyltransferase [Gregarina niphandrodes]
MSSPSAGAGDSKAIKSATSKAESSKAEKTPLSTCSSNVSLVRREPIGHLSKGVSIPDNHRTPKESYCVPPHYFPLIEDIILTRGQIVDRIEKVASEMYEFYRDVEQPVVLVVTLKGAITFFDELSRALRKIANTDMRGLKRSTYLEEYIRCSSYTGTSRGPDLKVDVAVAQVVEYCKHKHVVIVEDLIDSGSTLKALYDRFSACDQVLSVRTVCGFSKRTPLWNGFIPDWVAFDVTDQFIVGFGCDVDNHFRDLDHLSTISECGKEKYLADYNQ